MMKKTFVLPVILAAVGLMGWPRAGVCKTAGPARCNGVVNINEAPVAKLMLLPHIGKTKAKAIVRHRTKTPFQRAADILKVKGIGKATFLRIKSCIRVSGATTIKAPTKGRRSRRSKARRKSRGTRRK